MYLRRANERHIVRIQNSKERVDDVHIISFCVNWTTAHRGGRSGCGLEWMSRRGADQVQNEVATAEHGVCRTLRSTIGHDDGRPQLKQNSSDERAATLFKLRLEGSCSGASVTQNPPRDRTVTFIPRVQMSGISWNCIKSKIPAGRETLHNWLFANDEQPKSNS